ncbi:hypothetical protein SVIOM74S_04174 [Streptomyces violarus]
MAARVPDAVHRVPDVLSGFVTVSVLGPDRRLNLGNRLYRAHGGERPVGTEEARPVQGAQQGVATKRISPMSSTDGTGRWVLRPAITRVTNAA